MRDLLLKHLLRALPARALSPVDACRALWPALVGSSLAARSRPLRVDRETLVVECATPALAQELRFVAPDVLQALSDLEGHAALPRIRRLLANVGDPAHFPPPTKRAVIAPLSSEPLNPTLQASLEAVEDDDLRERLERISRIRDATHHDKPKA